MGEAKPTRTGLNYQQVQAIVAYYDSGETRSQYVARMVGDATESQVAAVFEEHGRRKAEVEREQQAVELRRRQKRERLVLKQVDAETNPYLRRVDRLVRGGH